jgi:hypothetical protein
MLAQTSSRRVRFPPSPIQTSGALSQIPLSTALPPCSPVVRRRRSTRLFSQQSYHRRHLTCTRSQKSDSLFFRRIVESSDVRVSMSSTFSPVVTVPLVARALCLLETCKQLWRKLLVVSDITEDLVGVAHMLYGCLSIHG